MKASAFDPRGKYLTSLRTPETGRRLSREDIDFNLSIWNKLGIVMDVLKLDIIHVIFVKDQADIHATFVRFDEIRDTCGNGEGPMNFAQVCQPPLSHPVSSDHLQRSTEIA